MQKTWPMRDAKARFSKLLRAAQTGPQHIACRGKAKAVLISAKEFRKLRDRSEGMTFYEWWNSAPKIPEFKLPPRRREPMRKVKL